MEVCFDLLIPRGCFGDDFPFKEEVISWGNESFSQDPPCFAWKGVVKFEKQKMPKHILNDIPSDLDVSDWVYLSLKGDALKAWEMNINKPSFDELLPMLKEMLDELLPLLSEWVVVFELNCDQIDNVYQMDKSILLDKIESVLNWCNEPEGFISWGKRSK